MDKAHLLHAHARALQACNQRGGRMLSLVDLLEAGTVDLPLAAYLAAAMREGASLLVGARPGGAGKTAVMCALLNFLPNHTTLQALDGAPVFASAAQDARYGETCYLAHEIGSGYYYAYIWGKQVVDFLALAARGHIVASNLHADTLEETRHQLCRQNGAREAHLQAVTLKLYLRMSRGAYGGLERRVARVYESDGAEDRLLWKLDANSDFVPQSESRLISAAQQHVYADLLADFQHRGVQHIEDVRQETLKRSNVQMFKRKEK